MRKVLGWKPGVRRWRVGVRVGALPVPGMLVAGERKTGSKDKGQWSRKAERPRVKRAVRLEVQGLWKKCPLVMCAFFI